MGVAEHAITALVVEMPPCEGRRWAFWWSSARWGTDEGEETGREVTTPICGASWSSEGKAALFSPQNNKTSGPDQSNLWESSRMREISLKNPSL
jgi:hypothetical protein